MANTNPGIRFSVVRVTTQVVDQQLLQDLKDWHCPTAEIVDGVPEVIKQWRDTFGG